MRIKNLYALLFCKLRSSYIPTKEHPVELGLEIRAANELDHCGRYNDQGNFHLHIASLVEENVSVMMVVYTTPYNKMNVLQ